MKIKQRKRTAVIKNLRSACISDQKTKSVYFKLRPLPPLSYTTAEYCLYIFLFLGSEGGHGTLRTLVYAGQNLVFKQLGMIVARERDL